MNHTADLGVYFYGSSPEDLLARAGLSLFRIILTHPPGTGQISEPLEIEGTDQADLLVCWLGELLYLFQVRELVPVAVNISRLSQTRLQAHLRMTHFDLSSQGPITEIKAATYHQVEFGPHRQGWRARVIFDL